MAALVFGHLGQRVVKRVVLVLNQEADPVITQPLPVGDKTALGTPLKQRVAKSSHVQVRNSYFVRAFMKVRQSVVFMQMMKQRVGFLIYIATLPFANTCIRTIRCVKWRVVSVFVLDSMHRA